MSKDGHDGAIQVKNQSRSVLGLMDKMLQQPVVHTMELLPKAIWRLEQKATQGLWIRKAGQSGQVLKGAIGT